MISTTNHVVQGIAQYAEQQPSHQSEGVNYVDDSQIYDYDHQGEDSSRRQNPNISPSRTSQHSNGGGGYDNQKQYGRSDRGYDQYGRMDQGGQGNPNHGNENEEMW